MKLLSRLSILTLLFALASTLLVAPAARDAALLEADSPSFSSHVKRKGGGGGGGKGGGSSGSSSGSRGGSSSSSSGSSSSGSRSGSSPSSNIGGATRSGSGAPRAFGGGSYYGGGAGTPYSAGKRSPKGIAPFLLLGAGLAIFPGLWLYGAYAYPYSHPYTFYNQSFVNQTVQNGLNQTKPVLCLCGNYAVCGCDENTDARYLNQVIGNGSYAALNQSLVRVTDVNGTNTIVINGTLPNGTTASGGTDPATSGTSGSPSPTVTILNGGRRMAEFAGWWTMISLVSYCVYFL